MMRRIFLKRIGWLAALALPFTRNADAQPWRERPFGRRGEARDGASGIASEMEDFEGPPSALTLPAGTVVERDLAYGSSPAQRLDVYRPSRADKAPVIFMVHGGAWMRGNKAAPRVIN